MAEEKILKPEQKGNRGNGGLQDKNILFQVIFPVIAWQAALTSQEHLSATEFITT